ncbi:MAG: hypothetical protein AABX32_05330 [Nanoarchaeota archaeon]
MASANKFKKLIDGIQARDSLNAILRPGYVKMYQSSAEHWAEKLMHFSNTERKKRWNIIISAEAFLAYAARGYQDSTGVELPIPELVRQISLYAPLVTIPLGASLGKSTHELENLLKVGGDKSSSLVRILEGVDFTASRTIGAGAVGYLLGYHIGYFSR